MPFLSVQRYVGFAKEATRGTAAAADLWLPIDSNPTFEPKLKWLPTKSLKGSPVEQYDDIPSTESTDYSFKGNVFLDTFPILLQAILGHDAVTGTAAPYTHTLGLLNTASTGSQPSSYTITDVDLITEATTHAAKEMAAGQCSELSIDFSADGALTYSAKFTGDIYAETGKPTSTSFSTEVFVPAWNGKIKLTTTTSDVVVSGSIDIKRPVTPIFTVGKQGPYRVWAGPAEVTGKFVFVAEANDTTFTSALTRAHKALAMTFTDPVSTHSVEFQMSAAQLKDPKVESSKAWEEISANFTAQSNSTDAVSTGYAPIKATVKNAQKTAY